MKIKIDSNKLLDYFENFGQFIEEAIIQIKQDGIYAKASDRAMVCVCEFKIPPSDFDNYEIDKETDIGLNINHFIEILKRNSKGGVSLNLVENKLMVGFGNRTFTIPLLELSKEEKIPEMKDFTTEIELKTDIFTTAIKDGNIISDNIVFETDDGKMTFRANSDVSSFELVVEKEILISGKGRGRYSLDYLKKLKIKADKVKIQFGKDYPAVIGFGNFKMILAPRIEG